MSVRHQYTSICTVCRAPLGPGDSACSNPARVDCPACQSIARGDRLPTAPAQPDPNSGWIPLTPGCAMPEDKTVAQVTLEHDQTGERYVDFASFYSALGPVFWIRGDRYGAPNFAKFNSDWRLTAWRPAPQPYREVSK